MYLLTNLEELVLIGTNVTDSGLAHLNGLTNLRSLLLGRTAVTDYGINELQESLPDCYIDH